MAITHSTRASVDWSASSGPWGICDRCGMQYNLSDLAWQYDWRGMSLVNLRILVCEDKCLDEPQEQLRAIFIPPDPAPVEDARPGFQRVEMTDYRVTQTPDPRITQAGDRVIIDGENPYPASEILDIP